ncbi:MAG: hypothetical protein LBU41_02345 [Clostridiales Family XIII bacterium]|jgi:hypothetical protein|nr:hypothetical protein [Clostridiales Family XIII bacterium]
MQNFKKQVPRIISIATVLFILMAGVLIGCSNHPTQEDESNMTSGSSQYEAREWINDDYDQDNDLQENKNIERKLPEFPDATFQVREKQSFFEELTVTDASGEKSLFQGMPILNVYLADLTGDGLPDFCATVAMGSGVIDTHVLVYDYAADKEYLLEDRMVYDYALSLIDARLIVSQSSWESGEELATGDLAIIDGELVGIGIDRTIP